MTLPIPQFTTSRLATHGNKMRKVIRGKVTLCVITSEDCYAMTRIDSKARCRRPVRLARTYGPYVRVVCTELNIV